MIKQDEEWFYKGLDSQAKSMLMMINEMRKKQKKYPNACSDTSIVNFMKRYLKEFLLNN